MAPMGPMTTLLVMLLVTMLMMATIIAMTSRPSIRLRLSQCSAGFSEVARLSATRSSSLPTSK